LRRVPRSAVAGVDGARVRDCGTVADEQERGIALTVEPAVSAAEMRPVAAAQYDEAKGLRS
jgi:hypothetical protein